MSEKLVRKFSEKEDFSDIDHIIIGSGIGGLTTANWLAFCGHKVVVLEQHYQAGGLTHAFKRKHGFSWDVGVHYVGNVAYNGSLKSLFDFVFDGDVKWNSLGAVYDEVRVGDNRYEILSGIDNYKKKMISYFPEEEEAITQYLEAVDQSNRKAQMFFFEKSFKPILQKTISPLFLKPFKKFSQRTTLSVLQEITTNKELIAVLCAQCGNYGLTPKYGSFAAHALIVGHFMEGGYYPEGGSEVLANAAIKKLNAKNGRVYINSTVEEIVIEKKKVKGVKVNGTFIPCKSVISNVGVLNTKNHLLTSDSNAILNWDTSSTERSTGHMCLYVGLDASDEDLGLPKNNIWSFSSNEYDDIFDNTTLENTGNDFTYISFPSAKDQAWNQTHPNSATIQVVAMGKHQWLEQYENEAWRKRGVTYEDAKEHFKNAMLEKLYNMFPQIKGHVQVTEVSTPLSTQHFTKYDKGEIYGLAHSKQRFSLPFLRPETKIKGLRMVGQDITIVGVAGAMLSGMLCSITILKFRVWRVFMSVTKFNKINKEAQKKAL